MIRINETTLVNPQNITFMKLVIAEGGIGIIRVGVYGEPFFTIEFDDTAKAKAAFDNLIQSVNRILGYAR